MNAQIVWQVWRRILREPTLQHDLLEVPLVPDHMTLIQQRYHFTDEEAEAATAYARLSSGVQWFVVNYRYRLVNSFLNALETGAPLTLRALLANQVDLKQLAVQFLDNVGWKDYGPNVYTYCRDALLFIDTGSAIPAGIRDLIGLEQTAIGLLLDLAKEPHAHSIAQAQTPYARLYCSKTGISDWLRDKSMLGRSTLETAKEYYLVYLPEDGASHRFARLPERAAQLYLALNRPQSKEALSGDEQLLAMLRKYRAIHPNARTIGS